jgi:hypothetical protein
MGCTAGAASAALIFVQIFTQAHATETSDWFAAQGKSCPLIDEIDAQVRSAHSDWLNAAVVKETVESFAVVYFSLACTPKEAGAQYHGEAVYNAIVSDYRARHPQSQVIARSDTASPTVKKDRRPEYTAPAVPVPEIAPAPAATPAPTQTAQVRPANSSFIGKWRGKETCGGTPRTVELSVQQGANGGLEVNGTAVYGFSSRPFAKAQVLGDEVQMISSSSLGDAVYNGALVSTSRIEGTMKRPLSVGKICSWYADRQ